MSRTTSIPLVFSAALFSASLASADSPAGSDRLTGAWLDRPINIVFREAPLGRVLATIGELAGTPIELPPDLHYNVSFDMRGVPGRRALEVIAESQGLVFRQQNGVILVEPRDAARPAGFVPPRNAPLPLTQSIRVLLIQSPKAKAVPPDALATFKRAIVDSVPNVTLVPTITEATDVIELVRYAWSPDEPYGVSQTWQYWYQPLERPAEPPSARAKPAGFIDTVPGKTLSESTEASAQKLRARFCELLPRFQPVVPR
jgi:hypothetical protein